MSSILDNEAIRDAVLPISVEQYHQLGEAGILHANTELLRGIIVDKTIKSPEHSWVVERIAAWFRARVPSGCLVRQEQPLTFAESEPEPDVAIVAGSTVDFRAEHPKTAMLVVEVAITSVELDREKCEVYAEAGVQEYWLVLPNEEVIEVFSNPVGGCYQAHQQFQTSDTIRSQVLPNIAFPIATIFAP
jgi:Uma2 family endonuclease